MARKIEVPIVGDSSKLQKAFRDSSKAGSTWGSKMSKIGKVAGLGLAAGIGIAAIALKKSVDAAKEAEVSQKKMEAQLKASGISYAKFGQHIDDTIQKQSKLAAFDDEEMQDSFTGLVRVTGNVNKALKLNALAADVARGSNMDMATAGKLIGKVAAGNTSLLKRYGIQVKDGATAQEALAAVQKKFGGQAKAYGETAAGAQERFGIALENLQEKIGQKVLPILTKLFNKGAELMAWAEENWPRFSAAIQDAIDKVRPIFQNIVDYWNGTLLPTIESIVDLARGFWGKFGEDIRRVFDSVKKIIGNALNVARGIIELVMALIRGDWSAAWDAIKRIAKNALSLLVTFLQLILTNIAHAAKAIGLAILNGIVDQAKKAPGRVGDLIRQLPGKLRDLAGIVKNAALDLGRAIIQGIVDGLSGLFGAVFDKIKDGVKGAIDAAKDHLGSTAAEYAARNLGAPIGEGVAAGIAGSLGSIRDALGATGRAAITAPTVAGASSGVPAVAARSSHGAGGGGGRMELALVAVGPDILRQLRELDRRARLGGAPA